MRETLYSYEIGSFLNSVPDPNAQRQESHIVVAPDIKSAVLLHERKFPALRILNASQLHIIDEITTFTER